MMGLSHFLLVMCGTAILAKDDRRDAFIYSWEYLITLGGNITTVVLAV